jgi:hypothetical protein
LTLTEGGYLKRLADRQLQSDVKRLAGFGIIVGGIIALLSSWMSLFVVSQLEIVWNLLFLMGLGFVVSALVVPQALYWPELAFVRITNLIGNTIFTILLSVIYVVLLLPLGQIYRRFVKVNPIFSWIDQKTKLPRSMWEEKDTVSYMQLGKIRQRNFFVQMWSVFGFFINKKQWVLIPSIVVLIIMGIIFFFIQSSVLAPFIYTLF